jgi:hypothetical protein
MNKIYLDKLCEFTYTTYKNYDQFNIKEKEYNIDEQIQIIKQNLSLNEKGVNNKFNYVELSSLIPNIQSDQLVLLQPLAYNIKENYEWNYLLNALLIVLNDEHMYKSNVIKKKTIETFDNTFRKKIVIENNITDEILQKISKLVNITMVILTPNDKKILNNKKDVEKVVMLFKNGKEYYPILNWSEKFYTKTNAFFEYILTFEPVGKNNSNTNTNINQVADSDNSKVKKTKKKDKELDENIKLKKTKSNITIDEEKNTVNTINTIQNKNTDSSDKKNNNDFYEEVITEANNAIFMSEAVDNKESIVSSTSKKNEEIKKNKSKKNSKDIFVVNNDKKVKEDKKVETKQEEKVIEDDSVFKKTEVLTKKEIENLKSELKKNISLSDIQNIATKLSLSIAKVSEKTGKPKAKTKQELTDEINEYLSKM